MAPFGLFKRKKGEEPDLQQPSVSLPSTSSLTIQQAQSLLQEIESKNLRSLVDALAPIKASADVSLRAIGVLAADMEKEKIKLEGLEQRFKSLVENSRKTIVVTLRRESSTDLTLPESVNDVRKFREKFEVMMKRFGEVSGSHSKILNNFMKRNAARMKQEFETLDELLAQTKTLVADFEQRRVPIVKCSTTLNTLSQKTDSVKSGEIEIEKARREIGQNQDELTRIAAESATLRQSPEFHDAEVLAQQIENARAQREDLHSKILDQFSHMSRAFTKYSYGVSKETEARLNLMSTEPWKLLELDDISPYFELLQQVRKSVVSGKIQLKDSDKMVHYIDLIIQSFPDFQERARQVESGFDALKEKKTSAFDRAKKLEQEAAEAAERVARSKDNLDLLIRQNDERKSEVNTLLTEASELLSSITGQRYPIEP